MAKKDVSLLLLGIVAILAIVGLVLLFTSPVATGKVGAEVQPTKLAYDTHAGQIGNPIYVREGYDLPRCPGGYAQTLIRANERVDGNYYDVYSCTGSGYMEETYVKKPSLGTA